MMKDSEVDQLIDKFYESMREIVEKHEFSEENIKGRKSIVLSALSYALTRFSYDLLSHKVGSKINQADLEDLMENIFSLVANHHKSIETRDG